MWRVFSVNYQVNFLKIELYTEKFGLAWGAGYYQDLYSLVVDESLCVAMTITQYFGGSSYFTMTPTLYGESYYNFGNLYFCSVFFVWFARALLDAFFKFMPLLASCHLLHALLRGQCLFSPALQYYIRDSPSSRDQSAASVYCLCRCRFHRRNYLW